MLDGQHGTLNVRVLELFGLLSMYQDNRSPVQDEWKQEEIQTKREREREKEREKEREGEREGEEEKERKKDNHTHSVVETRGNL